ncbi:MAG: hypothetical protein ACRDS9_10365 [Pseudonocardiaceae bacterium]
MPDLEAIHAKGNHRGRHRDVTPIARGRALVDYFFVTDPDRMYVEIVNNVHDLDWRRPLILSDAQK